MVGHEALPIIYIDYDCDYLIVNLFMYSYSLYEPN